MDRGASRAIVRLITKSQTRLREGQALARGPRAFDGRASTVAEASQLPGLSHQTGAWKTRIQNTPEGFPASSVVKNHPGAKAGVASSTPGLGRPNVAEQLSLCVTATGPGPWSPGAAATDVCGHQSPCSATGGAAVARSLVSPLPRPWRAAPARATREEPTQHEDPAQP